MFFKNMENHLYEEITLKLAPSRMHLLIRQGHRSKPKEAGLIPCAPDDICHNNRLNDEGYAMVKSNFNEFSFIIEELKKKRTECSHENKYHKRVCPVKVPN
jgi:hypothetical protein